MIIKIHTPSVKRRLLDDIRRAIINNSSPGYMYLQVQPLLDEDTKYQVEQYCMTIFDISFIDYDDEDFTLIEIKCK